MENETYIINTYKLLIDTFMADKEYADAMECLCNLSEFHIQCNMPAEKDEWER